MYRTNLLKEGKGFLKLSVGYEKPSVLMNSILDDGVGIRQADEKMQKSTMRYTSRGRELTINRIHLLNELGYQIQIETDSSDKGTHVTIKIHTHDESGN